ncbi:hypothetical protein [Ottowia caeni]|uniref:hypothetical protein n=1 Tax=Ottowia caeni TaxID=2870339 RepID=UPI001E497EF0|nr:hypothetical protein [Ottowia caeni]
MADETVPHALIEHYLPSDNLRHTLLARRGEWELWRTVTKRAHRQLRDRVDYQILERGEWAMMASRKDSAWLNFEYMAARENIVN